jgi:hypothetical protein
MNNAPSVESVTDRKANSLPELATSHGLSLQFLRNEMRSGALRVTRFGRRVLVLREDWDAYVKARPTNN